VSLKNLIKTAEKNHGSSAPPGVAAITPAPVGSTYPLDQIQQREQDTRPLNEAHVNELADSIAALGLIEPIAVDNQGRLLAGGHRLAAVLKLQAEQPEAFQKHFPLAQIPARIFAFDAEQDPALALQIEIAENEKRRDYTPAEVRMIADRLRNSGYRDTTGKPKKGEQPLVPALQLIIGKSRRTVMTYLAGDEGKPEQAQSQTLLKRALKNLEEWRASSPDPQQSARIGATLEQAIKVIQQELRAD
jgi:ParB family transcriptional regulator, chromosome partitioning protein